MRALREGLESLDGVSQEKRAQENDVASSSSVLHGFLFNLSEQCPWTRLGEVNDHSKKPRAKKIREKVIAQFKDKDDYERKFL